MPFLKFHMSVHHNPVPTPTFPKPPHVFAKGSGSENVPQNLISGAAVCGQSSAQGRPESSCLLVRTYTPHGVSRIERPSVPDTNHKPCLFILKYLDEDWVKGVTATQRLYIFWEAGQQIDHCYQFPLC